MKGIQRDVTYPHPIERVWRALTEPRLLALWLMEPEGFEAREGCEFRFRTRPAPGFDGVIHCRVLEALPPHRLSYTWASAKQLARPTRVSWELRSVPAGTRLMLSHDGFSGVGGFILRSMLGRGWGHKLRDYMPSLLARLESSNDDPRLVDTTGLMSCDPPARAAHASPDGSRTG